MHCQLHWAPNGRKASPVIEIRLMGLGYAAIDSARTVLHENRDPKTPRPRHVLEMAFGPTARLLFKLLFIICM